MNENSLNLVLTELRATNSRKEKERILSDLTGDLAEDFKTVVYHAYHPRLNYFVKDADWSDIAEVEPNSDDLPVVDLQHAIQFLHDCIATRKYTGHKAIGCLIFIIGRLNADEYEIFKLILEKDLKVGASASTFNKIWPGLVPVHPYMRCSGFDEKVLKNLKFPCYSQPKMDGLYIDIVIENGSTSVYTRSGQDVSHYLDSNEALKLAEIADGTVLQGEALVLDDSRQFYLDRKTGNGYLNSDEVDPTRVRFIIWDAVPFELWNVGGGGGETYEVRLNNAREIVEQFNSLQLIETITCTDVQEIVDHFRKCRLKGEEGTVIKSETGLWKSGTSKDQIKCKVIFDCELEVVDFKEGKGKHEGKLGALICRSSDGMVEVSVGGGYTDAQREDYWENIDQVVGKIVTVRANDVVNDINDETGKFSLFLPRFVELRKDKTEADSYDKICQQVKSFTDLLSLIK